MGWIKRAKQAVSKGARQFSENVSGKRDTTRRRICSFEALEPRIVLSVAPGMVPVGSQPTGPLSGKVVYTSGGHGWEYFSSWSTNRPNLNGMIEGFGAQDQITYFADYLMQAGATVVSMRPVGHQLNEVVLDNDSAGVTFSGSWIDNTVGPRWYDEDYGAGTDAIKYRFANVSGSETATATYTPNIPQSGFYPVYTWVAHGANRTSQLYKINHTGGQTQIRVDHRDVGNGWVYLGTYHFDAGSSTTDGSVVISNQSTAGGSVVIADAIRFGNGMGDLPDGPGGLGTGSPSGQPREDEASIFWIWRGFGQGASPGSVIGSGNVSGPSDYAEHMNAAPFGDSVYIGFHSNAANGSARGAVGLIDNNNPTPNQSSLALYTGRQINQDMQALNGTFEHNWSTRQTHTFSGGFGEINLGSNAEMDATIIEVAFHDNVQDAQLLRDPRVRDQLGRSTYEAALEYFNNFGGVGTTTTLPSAPINVRAVSNASGEVTISWSAGPTGVHGHAATGYRIYASADGYGFDGGTLVPGGGATSATLSGYDPNIPYYFKVVAENAGGRSKASEVITALPSGGAEQVLIVNGFDRHGRHANFQYTSQPPLSTGVSDRVWSRYNNSFDYVVQVHSAIDAAQPGTHVDSTSNEAVISGAVNLADYHTVIWILGEESTVDDTFNATEQAKVEQFIAGGGNLFLSGAEIAWDLDAQNNGRSFFENTLLGNYVSDDAGTYTTIPAAGGIFEGMNDIVFSNGSAYSSLDGQFYNVAFPDVISPQAGAQVALNYNNGAGAAAIQVQGTGGRGSIVMFGFPFETITNATRRTNIMDRVLDFFATEVPLLEMNKYINGQDADTPPGPTLAAGATATFTYHVSNTGSAVLENVSVVDDNGTPGNVADDFSPAYTSGDSNGNSLLDVGETWIFTATPTLAAGQQTSLGTVTAEDSLGQVVSDSDAVNYFGSAPAIHVETYVNSEDADSPTGPQLEVGSTATFLYLVTNTGNVPLMGVLVVDDNGTPGNPADDFSPTYASGDTIVNGQLDTSETWVFFAQRPVSAGQYTSLGVAIGQDSINQLVAANDPTNYLGVGGINNADFNGDGLVDAADYLIWRVHNGTIGTGTQPTGDANGDTNVDSVDYGIWVSQFGTSPGSGTSPMAGAQQPASAQPASEPVVISAAPPSVVTVSETPAATSSRHDSPLIADAVFDDVAKRHSELQSWQRPQTQLRERELPSASGDWQGLLVTLAKGKAERETFTGRKPSAGKLDWQNEPLSGDLQPAHARLGLRLVSRLLGGRD